MILIRKRDLFKGTILGLFSGIFIFLLQGNIPDIPVFSSENDMIFTVVVDAGHGGEDGGAVSASGVVESNLNLAVALRLDALLRFTGIKTVMTRTEDVSIGDSSLTTIRKRKASDLEKRVDLVNTTPNAVLISIHQNSFPTSPVTHGAQVFWNTVPGAEDLAASIQNTLNLSVNPENKKKPKPIPASIYLTKHAQVPSVVVECGFLSNTDETARLQQPTYQLKLAAAVASGYLRCLKGESL